jgi:hypothetical protein
MVENIEKNKKKLQEIVAGIEGQEKKWVGQNMRNLRQNDNNSMNFPILIYQIK